MTGGRGARCRRPREALAGQPDEACGHGAVGRSGYIIPEIGAKRLDTWTPAHVRGLDNALARLRLSSATRLQTFATRSRALTVAHREGKVTRNVAKLVDAPRLVRPDTHVLTVEEIGRIISMGFRTLTADILGHSTARCRPLLPPRPHHDAQGARPGRRRLLPTPDRGLIPVEPDDDQHVRAPGQTTPRGSLHAHPPLPYPQHCRTSSSASRRSRG